MTETRTSIRASLITLTISVIVTLIIAEAGLRALDGFSFNTIKLHRTSTTENVRTNVRSDGSRHLSSITLSNGVDPSWYHSDPPPLQVSGRHDEQLKAFDRRAREIGRQTFDSYKVWNAALVEQYRCNGDYFQHLPNAMFVFEPSDGSASPRYKFLPATTTPLNLRTNAFGHRGPAMSLVKPANVIRIAFVGSSTTATVHGYPYSYPEFVEHWLNLWAKKQQIDIRFETINAGREGINSIDMEAVVRKELLPLAPDLFVYYEGSNQFKLNAITRYFSGQSAKARTGLETTTQENRFWAIAGRYSAIARRISFLTGVLSAEEGGEPYKESSYEIVWPEHVDEFDPDLNADNLPVNLSTIIRDLTKIKASADSIDADLAVSSFTWLAYDGMKLDPVRDASIYTYLNIGMAPYTYADIERLAQFQNRSFKKFAKENSLYFLDLAGKYPKDPELFVDAIHRTYGGVRLFGWLAFQELLPIIERKIASGAWPKKTDLKVNIPPLLEEPISTISPRCRGAVRSDAIALDQAFANNPQSKVIQGTPVRIVTAPTQHYYAANVPFNQDKLPESGSYQIEIDARIVRGKIGFGILNHDQSRFLATLDSSATQQDTVLRMQFDLSFEKPSYIIISNASDESSVSEALLSDIRLFVQETDSYPGIVVNDEILSNLDPAQY